VLAPSEQMEEERRRLLVGEKVDTVLPINIFARDYEVVDLFDWQQEIENMMSIHELAMELYVDDTTARRYVDEGRISPGPDLVLPMGRVTHRYFLRERLGEIRQQLNIKEREPDKIREDFFSFVRKGTMSTSYKPVMLLGMLTLADAKGQVDLAVLSKYFHDFYEQRVLNGLLIEVDGAAMNRVHEMNDFEVTRLMLAMPFEKFERKFFLEHRKDLTRVAFVPSLWRRLNISDRNKLINICQEQIGQYYERRL